MFDVAKLAFQSDSTRVVSLFINTYSIVPDLPGVTGGGREQPLRVGDRDREACALHAGEQDRRVDVQ